ncbi:acylphosphatase-1-like [Saccostrea cucullata]|uniref:acylphosphatase-1-like n=1 Tax=Saccostrea cuccullata TaxID=36930 RepID=UPI002ED401D2
MAFQRSISVDFELCGNVQGVAMKPYTYAAANKLGVVGNMMNTEKGTIRGTLQGNRGQVESMKKFLVCSGSPYSSVTKANFYNEHEVVNREFSKFTIDPTDW